MSNNKYKDLLVELLATYNSMMRKHFEDVSGSSFALEWSKFFIAWKERAKQTLGEDERRD